MNGCFIIAEQGERMSEADLCVLAWAIQNDIKLV
jgi:hypothetical protein